MDDDQGAAKQAGQLECPPGVQGGSNSTSLHDGRPSVVEDPTSHRPPPYRSLWHKCGGVGPAACPTLGRAPGAAASERSCGRSSPVQGDAVVAMAPGSPRQVGRQMVWPAPQALQDSQMGGAGGRAAGGGFLRGRRSQHWMAPKGPGSHILAPSDIVMNYLLELPCRCFVTFTE